MRWLICLIYFFLTVAVSVDAEAPLSTTGSELLKGDLESVHSEFTNYYLFTFSREISWLHGCLISKSPLDDTYVTFRRYIKNYIDRSKERCLLDYTSKSKEIYNLIGHDSLPTNLAWRFGELIGMYGNLSKEIALYNNLDPSNETIIYPEQAEMEQRLEFYKISLLFFAYSLGFSENSPAILQYEELEDLISHSELSLEVDRSFKNVFAFIDEKAWVEAIEKLDQRNLDNICWLLSFIHQFLLHNRDSLSESYQSLATHLGNILDSKPTRKAYNPDEVYGFDAYGSPLPLKLYLGDIEKEMSNWFSYEDQWRLRKLHEKLRSLPPLDDKYLDNKIRIKDTIQSLEHSSYYAYAGKRKAIFNLIGQSQLPRNLAWGFGEIMALRGNLPKEIALCSRLESSFDNDIDPEKVESTKRLQYYKTALLFFGYALGLNDSCPTILQYEEGLEDLISSPTFNSEINDSFQKEFESVDEIAWIQAIEKLDRKRLDHVCWLFRSMSLFFLHNQESLPKPHLSLGAHLCNILTKVVISAKSNKNSHMDAINAWIFRLYIDLKKWEVLHKADPSHSTPEIEILLPALQSHCLKLMPQGLSLEDITEQNEFAICEKVRMRNLTPTHQEDFQRDVARALQIIYEFEFRPYAIKIGFDYVDRFLLDRVDFAHGYSSEIKEFGDVTQQIYNYISGYIELSDIIITEENAREYLIEAKLFDIIVELWNAFYPEDNTYTGWRLGGYDRFYFPKTTYELRKSILKLCPQLKSYEVFTTSLNPEKIRDATEEMGQDGWLNESETLRQMCISNHLKNAQHLSEVMEHSPLQGIIVGTRGISGAGKSTFLKRNLLPLLISDGGFEEIESLMQGILNPDILKAVFKKLLGDALNIQVHEEASKAFKQVLKKVVNSGCYMLDRRNLTPQEIVADLVDPAKEGNRTVWLYDFDIPLSTGIYRILARPKYSEEPCPEYEALIDGFLFLRHYRNHVLELVLKEEAIGKYELYSTTEQKLAAQKIDGGLYILDPDLFAECLKVPTFQEIEDELSQLISDESIDEAIANGVISPDQRALLEPWRGMTLKKAVQIHVIGGNDVYDDSLLESPVVTPFNGKEWLMDYPQLIEYLQRNPLLSQELDKSGWGLYWEEMRVPGSIQEGFQMKLGYFIVPMANVELHLPGICPSRFTDWDENGDLKYVRLFSHPGPYSQFTRLSENAPSVAKELGVCDETGKPIGLRFFVHPRAYAHFSPLLRSNISFVSPSESEFMGTPTSDYSSWLIRDISTSDTTPFIVKMGIPKWPGDIKHLLSEDEIISNLSSQKSEAEFVDSFLIFKQAAGLILRNIPGYPAATLDSGIIISEIL